MMPHAKSASSNLKPTEKKDSVNVDNQTNITIGLEESRMEKGSSFSSSDEESSIPQV